MNAVQSFSGVVPSLAQVSDLGPPRSECGVGCLMPWAGALYVLNYSSHKRTTGTGVSLRRISSDMTMEIVPQTLGVDGTYTNRFVHHASNQIIIGPHVIDAHHNIRTVPELVEIRTCGTTLHMTDPDNLVYVLGMEGELFELNVRTLACRQIDDLWKTLGIDSDQMSNVHFKDCYCMFGRLVVVSNGYNDRDWAGKQSFGRLAEFDGKSWKIIHRKPFTCVSGRHGFGGTIFATGWDQASALMCVFTDADKKWTTYRLPKASHCFDHKWQTEWPRIRETEHERLLMDHHGMFYELSPWAYGNRVWGVRPISTHLWVLGDFCTWRGMMVMGADNASPSHGVSPTTAEPQSGLWFGKTDDLWNFGKPKGWGGPWYETPIEAGVPSDPYLMTGFDQKCLHLSHDAPKSIRVTVEIDFLGAGQFKAYTQLTVEPGVAATQCFPPGFSAHWVRLISDTACMASGQFFYT